MRIISYDNGYILNGGIAHGWPRDTTSDISNFKWNEDGTYKATER